MPPSAVLLSIAIHAALFLLAGTNDTISLGAYRWSSSWYLSRPLSQSPDWLALGRIVEESTCQKDSLCSRRLYLASLEKRTEVDEFKAELKDGICESLNHLDRGSVVGEPRRMHDKAEAERLLNSAAAVAGLDLRTIDSLKKSDWRKGLVAWFLSKNTSVGQGWISKQLGMDDSSNVSRAVRRVEKTEDQEVLAWKEKISKNA